MRRDSFLRGTFILLLGSLVSRLLGAVYRFILPLLMGGGDEGAYGMALFGMPYSIYSIALVLSTMGVPLAISKLVSEARARGDAAEVKQVFSVAMVLLAVSGALISIVLYLLAPYLAHNIWKNPDAYYSMVALAPAVFFVSVMSAFRGLFQGLQTMTPHALSQIIEQVVRVGTMFLLVIILVPYGLQYAAAGATFGATTGAVIGMIFLFIVFSINRRNLWGKRGRDLTPRKSNFQLTRDIIALAIPISVSGIVLPLMRFVDATVVPSRLINLGQSVATATTAYGYLESYSWPLVNVPAVFTTALAISLVPSVSASLARGDMEGIREKTLASLRIGALVGIPAAVGLYSLSTEIPAFFWQSPQAGQVLASLSGVAAFLSLHQVSSAALQGLGYPVIPMRNLIIGGLVKLGLTWVLTGVPLLGAAGAGLASVAGFLVAAGLNLTSLSEHIGTFSIASFMWRPAVASGIMAAVVRVVVVQLELAYGLGVAVLGSVALGALLYGIIVIIIGGVRYSDLCMVPRVGERLANILYRIGLIRS